MNSQGTQLTTVGCDRRGRQDTPQVPVVREVEGGEAGRVGDGHGQTAGQRVVRNVQLAQAQAREEQWWNVTVKVKFREGK